MLPGFRFLFAAIVLTMSILVFGLGAAALLRAAHEEFASTPAWHATPETMFAQQSEASRPVLALLRVDAPEATKAPDNVPAETAPVVVASTPVEPEVIVPPQPEASSPPEAAKPEAAVAETSPPVEAASAPADAPAAIDEPKVTTALASSSEVTPPSSEATPPAEAAPPAPEPASAPVAPATDLASTRIATLGGPPVTIGPPATSKEADKNTAEKRRQAQRAKARRRMAQRARQTAQASQLAADPFAQPTLTVRRH